MSRLSVMAIPMNLSQVGQRNGRPGPSSGPCSSVPPGSDDDVPVTEPSDRRMLLVGKGLDEALEHPSVDQDIDAGDE